MLEQFSYRFQQPSTLNDQLSSNGHPALQDELSGTENGTNVVFLHTTVDDDDQFNKSSPGG
jgi:hypothetical protein